VSEPRETARQIAERIVGEIAAMTFDRYGNYEYDNSKVADLIEAAIASLTADLAQARQEAGSEAYLRGPSSEPRETARQIAEQTLREMVSAAKCDGVPFDNEQLDFVVQALQDAASWKNEAIVKLTADLAQARLGGSQLAAELLDMNRRRIAAEQARDEKGR
jgi:hypothetical protein